jgi:hypothetical protein
MRAVAALLALACARGAHGRDRLYKTCPSPIPVLQNRLDIPLVFEQEKMMRGAELGVLHGAYARDTLQRWPSAVEYVLVDLWAPQENYRDLANAAQAVQDKRMNEAIENTRHWSNKVRICRNFTTVCATRYPNDYFDTLYVDARHDRLGVIEDLEAWWPKVKSDGLVCGHDFVLQDEGPEQSGQDWTKNFDGSIDTSRRAVRGAVEDWAARHKRQIQVTYRESDWPSWCIRR